MSEQNTYQHWQCHLDDQAVLWLMLDRQDTAVNSLNAAVLEEFNSILEQIAQKREARAVVIGSAKKTGFIAGADIDQFKTLTSVEMATNLIAQGQRIFDKLEQLPMPTVAMISGFCLGGGLELALACRYRVAQEDDKTRLGLPEVKLGIHPGWGGTVRLPKLIGATDALDLILTGRTLRAKAAAKLGVVDAAVPERLFLQTVQRFALNPPAVQKPKGWKAYTNSGILRLPISYMVGKQLRKKANPAHYPAPFAVLDHWSEHGVEGRQPYQVEVESIGRLLMTDTSRNLVKVFFLQEHLKKLAPKTDFKARHVHVVGAGVMGAGIAAWCAMRGLKVTIQDRAPELIGEAVKAADKLAKKRLKTPPAIMQMMDRFIPDPTGAGIANADVIIEAVSEKLEIKQAVFAELEKKAKPQAILATNTSTLCLEKINPCLNDPSRLVGIHFFNPVAQMPLVEVVVGEHTSQQVKDHAMSFVKAIDKLPLPVKSAPGFLVNRILMPYMLEAVCLLDEGLSGHTIDAAALNFGMPMGPITLADTVGLDICLAALESMGDAIGGKIPEGLKAKVAQGHLGCKTNQGYYHYKNGKCVDKKPKVDHVPQDISDRLVLRMVNESMACLREGIVEDEKLLDAGSIFGFGFPPFRGGIMNYVSMQGAKSLHEQLDTFTQRYGDRFKADARWQVTENIA